MSKLSTIRNIILSGIIEYNLYKYDHICWIKTILYNGLWFGNAGLRHLPILIYNNVEILSKGKILIDGEMSYGMVRLGIWKAKSHNKTRLMNFGTIVFKGDTVIQAGCVIEVYGGKIEFGRHNKFAESCKIMCNTNITIRDHVTVGYESTFMDTDFHFTIDVNNYKVLRNEGKIIIGEGSWISSNCKIMKGVKLPKYSVVCTNSLVLGDFSKYPETSMFAGIPAKPIKNGKRRIFDKELESKLLTSFRNNTDLEEIILKENDLDSLCYGNKIL